MIKKELIKELWEQHKYPLRVQCTHTEVCEESSWDLCLDTVDCVTMKVLELGKQHHSECVQLPVDDLFIPLTC